MSKLAIKYQGNLRKIKHVKQTKYTQVYCANGSKNQQKNLMHSDTVTWVCDLSNRTQDTPL